MTIVSKAGKKTNFKEPLNILISSLGGDTSNLTCAGSSVENDAVSGMAGQNSTYLN